MSTICTSTDIFVQRSFWDFNQKILRNRLKENKFVFEVLLHISDIHITSKNITRLTCNAIKCVLLCELMKDCNEYNESNIQWKSTSYRNMKQNILLNLALVIYIYIHLYHIYIETKLDRSVTYFILLISICYGIFRNI